MKKKNKRIPGVEKAHPFRGISRIHPHAASVDIGAMESVACVPGDQNTKIVKAFGNQMTNLSKYPSYSALFWMAYLRGNLVHLLIWPASRARSTRREIDTVVASISRFQILTHAGALAETMRHARTMR